MNRDFSSTLAAALVCSSITLLTACGGGTDTGTTNPVATLPQPASPAAATGAYGPVIAQFSLNALSSETPTNANTDVFQGALAMCSPTVAGANMCLGASAGMLGNVAPAPAGGKCTYLNLGPTQIPRGFDVLFRANDGRTIQFSATSNSQEFIVGQTLNVGFGDIGLYQPDGKQWLTNGNNASPGIQVAAVSHSQIVLKINNLPMPANTGFGAVGSIILSGSATINCAPNLESVR
jgi:hypothetical protein